MKKIKVKGKLKLNKMTVSKLNDTENVVGGTGRSIVIICIHKTFFNCVTFRACPSILDACPSLRACPSIIGCTSEIDACPSLRGCTIRR